MSLPEIVLEKHPDCFCCQLADYIKPDIMSIDFIPYHVSDGFCLECPATKEQYEEWGKMINSSKFRNEPI